LVTVRGSVHMSLSDGPSYLTARGRSLAGRLAFGSISGAAMTAKTGDSIAAFEGLALGVKHGESLDQVLARHRRFVRTVVSVPG
jgi:hypothetical protein